MFDPVFTASRPHTGIAPMMFGDEFGVRTSGNGLRLAAGAHLERFPFSAAPPGILDTDRKIDMFDVVLQIGRAHV